MIRTGTTLNSIPFCFFLPCTLFAHLPLKPFSARNRFLLDPSLMVTELLVGCQGVQGTFLLLWRRICLCHSSGLRANAPWRAVLRREATKRQQTRSAKGQIF